MAHPEETPAAIHHISLEPEESSEESHDCKTDQALLRKALEVSGVRGRIRTAIEDAAESQTLHSAILQAAAAAESEALPAKPTPAATAGMEVKDLSAPAVAEAQLDPVQTPATEVSPALVRGSTDDATDNRSDAGTEDSDAVKDESDKSAIIDEVSDTTRSDAEAFWAAVPVDDVKAQPDEASPVLDEDSAVDSKQQPPRKEKRVISQAVYPDAAAQFFGEAFAHRLRWSHAVNSKRKLRGALITSGHFLEADVSFGSLVCRDETNGRRKSHETPQPKTTVCTAAGAPVIMAHYPTEMSSDLSLEDFFEQVLTHNERVSRSNSSQQDAKFASDGIAPKDSDEALAFVKQLDRELDQAAANSSSLASCVGSRRHHSQFKSISTMKGVKLDFKRFECVKPAIAHLRKVDAARRLDGHLWLNADVFAGPGALMSPMDARDFVTLCAEALPEAVLSLSWGSSFISATRAYTPDMVGRMVELCMTPIVPGSMAEGRPSVGPKPDGSDGDMHFTPAAVCRHITFGIAAEYALRSAEGLCRLLDCVPGTSLTIFSGAGSFSTTPAYVGDLVKRYGSGRLFLDLKLAKAWSRSCGTASSCSVQ